VIEHQELEYWPLDRFVEYARNPRKNDHAVPRVAAAIREFGFKVPILARSDGLVVDGHLRLKAARSLGLETVPVLLADDLTDTQIKAFRISVNRMADLAEWDQELLALELEDLRLEDYDLDLTGFDAEALDALMGGVESTPDGDRDADADTAPQVDQAEELRKKWGVVTGQLWALGDHRLLCGDCTSEADIGRLMGGELANCCFTSPPYAMQRKSSYGGTPVDQYPEWFAGVAANVQRYLADDGSFFVNIKEHVEDGERSLYVFETIKVLRAAGWRYVDQLIWAKPGLPGAWMDRLKNDFEPVHFFTKRDKITWMVQCVDVDTERFADIGDASMVDLYEDIYHFTRREKIKFNPRCAGKESKMIRVYDKDKSGLSANGNVGVDGKYRSGIARPSNVLWLRNNMEKADHPAMFPVTLPSFFMKLTTDTGELVYEPFSGSGTTIIAGENLGRRVRASEISPGYVAVALQRYQDHTGRTPTLCQG